MKKQTPGIRFPGVFSFRSDIVRIISVSSSPVHPARITDAASMITEIINITFFILTSKIDYAYCVHFLIMTFNCFIIK